MTGLENDDFGRANGLKYAGEYTDPATGRTMPLYEMGGWINTTEGWNMHVALRNGEISEEEYKAARGEYNKREGW